jgi:hypothetical protein
LVEARTHALGLVVYAEAEASQETEGPEVNSVLVQVDPPWYLTAVLVSALVVVVFFVGRTVLRKK